MHHISMTGYYAGIIVCGQDKHAGDTSSHMPYTREGERAMLERPDMCPRCKEEWMLAAPEPEGDDHEG